MATTASDDADANMDQKIGQIHDTNTEPAEGATANADNMMGEFERVRKQTERGQSHKMDLLKRDRSDCLRSVNILMNEIQQLKQDSNNLEKVKDKLKLWDVLKENLASAHSIIICISVRQR